MVGTVHHESGEAENGSESIEAEFWQQVAAKIRATESDVQGCYEAELTNGDGPESYAVADAYAKSVDSTDALVLVFPTEKTNPTPVKECVVGLNVGLCSLTATVKRSERSDGLLTVWLTGPEVEQINLSGGELTKEHLEIL